MFLILPFIMVISTDKLIEYRLQKQIVRWIKNCLKSQVQRAVVRGTKSNKKEQSLVMYPRGQ